MLAGLVLLLAIYAWFWFPLYRDYLLVRDDPGNIGGTVAEGLRGWLTRGMADYYHVYPEWPQPAFANFYRPAWNLILFVEQAVLGRQYWAWFLAFCALQYAGALLFLRLLRSLEVENRSALLFTALFLFHPAFVSFGFVYPGFQFDVFVSLMLLAAFHQLLRGRNGAALALVTLAVFTKETAIFAPVAAAATVLLLQRDVKWSLAMLMPLLAWIAARWLAFHAVMGGTFASPTSFHDLLANIGQGLMIWPSGAVAHLPLQLSGAEGAAQGVLLLVNILAWAILVHAAWQVVRAFRSLPDDSKARRLAALLIWTLGALSFCLLTRPQVRFGAIFFAFLLLLLACFPPGRPRQVKLLAVLLLACVTVIRDGSFLWHAVADEAAERNSVKALYAGLRALPQDGRAVYVVNAPTMLSAPVFIAKAWALKLDISFLNQVRGCSRATQAGYALSPTSLSVTIPSCAAFVLAGVPDAVQAKALAGDLPRPGVGAYRFSGRGQHGDFGHQLRIVFMHRPATVLAYDWQAGTYRVLGSR